MSMSQKRLDTHRGHAWRDPQQGGADNDAQNERRWVYFTATERTAGAPSGRVSV
jgi:hypothetical protein